MTAHCGKVEFDLQPVQAEAVWDGVVQADSLWCFPRQGSYKMKLREVHKNYARFKSQAKRLQKYVLKEFTAAKQYKQFSDAILEFVQPSQEEQEWQDIIGQVVNYD